MTRPTIVAVLGAILLAFMMGFAHSSDPARTSLVIPDVEETTDSLVLTISTPRTEYKAGEQIPLTITLRNAGKKPLTLVQPMDGSSDGWSTPIVAWSILTAGTDVKHPKDPPIRKGGRCGNCNAVKPEDVFVLQPNEAKRLNGWCAPPDLSPGDLRIVFYYHNVPTMEKKGLPLGKHDPTTMDQIRNSHPCRLMSNEIRLTIR
jgi:hypothetical protein